MIIRPLDPAPAENAEFFPAWSVIDKVQRMPFDSGWMITQPSHAVLAGDFSGRIVDPRAPRLGPALVRAISLHDAGWGIADAQAILQSRSNSQRSPRSFIQCSVSEFLEAWEKSIEAACSTGPAGGYMVSRHFTRIAQQTTIHAAEVDEQRASEFLKNESKRQKQLAGKQESSIEDLERLTDVLQFCDLLSLYVCSGAKQSVEFPEYFGVRARVSVAGDTYRIEPQLVERGAEFAVAALRHPAVKGLSGRELKFQIG